MAPTLKDLLALAGGGAVVIAAVAGFSYWLFKLFSEKWLTAKFSERLEDYRHKQQRELEELRFKINALMDRTTKLHQREFDVLPEAWGKLIDAHGYALGATSAFQMYPDLDRMTAAHLEEFLEGCPLANWQKEEIKRDTKKTDQYTKAIDRHKTSQARDKCSEFYVYFRKNGIFIREEIKGEFDAIGYMIHDALVEQEVHLQHPNYGPDSRKSRTRLSKESDAALKQLEKRVQARLWDSQASGSTGGNSEAI